MKIAASNGRYSPIHLALLLLRLQTEGLAGESLPTPYPTRPEYTNLDPADCGHCNTNRLRAYLVAAPFTTFVIQFRTRQNFGRASIRSTLLWVSSERSARLDGPEHSACLKPPQPSCTIRGLEGKNNGLKSSLPRRNLRRFTAVFASTARPQCKPRVRFREWADRCKKAGPEELNAMFYLLLSALFVSLAHRPLRPLKGSNSQCSACRECLSCKRSSVVLRWRATRIPAAIASTRCWSSSAA
jgi:hypothetical protein